MAFCTQCGASYADDAKYCGQCGQALPTPSVTPTTSAPIESDSPSQVQPFSDSNPIASSGESVTPSNYFSDDISAAPSVGEPLSLSARQGIVTPPVYRWMGAGNAPKVPPPDGLLAWIEGDEEPFGYLSTSFVLNGNSWQGWLLFTHDSVQCFSGNGDSFTYRGEIRVEEFRFASSPTDTYAELDGTSDRLHIITQYREEQESIMQWVHEFSPNTPLARYHDGVGSILHQIPGFRTGSSWKAVIALVGYALFGLWMVIGVSPTTTLHAIFMAIGLEALIAIFLVTNAWGIWDRLEWLPGFRSRVWWKADIAVAAYGFIAFWIIILSSAGMAAFALVTGIGALAVIFIVVNAWHVRSRLPLVNSPNQATQVWGWVLLGLIGFGIFTASLATLPSTRRNEQVNASNESSSSAAGTIAQAEVTPRGAIGSPATNTPGATDTPGPTALSQQAIQNATVQTQVAQQTQEIEQRRVDADATRTTQEAEQATLIAQAQEHVESAHDYDRAGQFGLALVELDQALGIIPGFEPALQLQTVVKAEAFVLAEQAKDQATAQVAAAAAARTQATQETQNAQTTATATAKNADRIPGLTAVDVTGNLRNRGFQCTGPNFTSDGATWDCTQSIGSARLGVHVWGNSPSSIWLVDCEILGGTAQQASDFLGYLATTPYAGAEPVRARQWVTTELPQAGQGVIRRTVIGGVEFLLFGPPTARSLQLSAQGFSGL